MATFNSLQDDLVLCPYSRHHKVKRGRLNIHISKCRRDDRRRQLKPCPFNPDHDAPAEPEGYRQHLATCPDRTTKLLCTETRDDPPYEVPAPGGAQPFHHEPEEKWVAEPGRPLNPFKPAVPPIFRTVTGLKPAERRRYYQSLSANGPPVVYVPGRYPQPSTMPAAFSTRGFGKADSGDEEDHWGQARELESKAVRPPDFRPIQMGQPHNHQLATQAESRRCSVQETLAHKSLLVAPQAAKASQPSSSQALATREQSNQASQSCASQVTQDHGHPRSTKAEAGEPSALQATQPLTDHPKKPPLAVQAEAVTGDYRGIWDKARVCYPCGAEVTHPTGNLGAERASANQPWAVQTSTTQDQSAPPAPGAIDVSALARRLMGLGSTQQHQSYG